MRILHVISSANLTNGGPIEGIRQRAVELAKMGHEVEVACSDAPDSAWLNEFSFPVHGLGPGKGGYGMTPNLIPWLLENGKRFDAVIANGIWQHTSFATRKAMWKLGKPYFVFTHGMLDPWFKVTYPLKHLKKCLYWPFGEYRVLRDAKAVLFTCEEEKVLARQSFRPYKVNERVVNYGTAGSLGDAEDQRAQFFATFPELEGKRLFLFLSRIHPKKGCDILIKAFAQIADEDPNLHLVMAGPDQVGLQGELEALAKSLKIENRITWTGMISGDMKWGAYHASEIFVLPSHQENFGIVVAESLSCGKPVLISNKVNIWREIEEAGAGIVGDDTIEATVKSLKTWLSKSEAEKSQMSQAARDCFAQNFEIHQAAQSLLDVLTESQNDGTSRR